jgi:hypothetical protein
MIGGGVEGYTGSLAPRIKVGPDWSAAIVFKPTSILGIELAYTGAFNAFVPSRLVGFDPSIGASVQRNGGHAAISVGLTTTRVQPYLMAGVGVDRYSVRGAHAGGYVSTTSGSVPLGGGVRAYFPHGFTMDLRGTYSLIFGNLFTAHVSQAEGLALNTVTDVGHWDATLFLGYTF